MDAILVRSALVSALLLASAATVQAQDITNGGFESGDFTGWTVVDSPMPYIPMQVSSGFGNPGSGFFTHMPTEGTFGLAMGFESLAAPVTMTMSQDVTVDASRSNLRFRYRAAWDMFNFGGSTMDREGYVRVYDVTGMTQLFERRFVLATAQSVNFDTGDRDRNMDLSPFAGQTVQVSFEWELPEANTGPGFLQLDNIRMEGDILGSNYCTAVQNSTGSISEMSAVGSLAVASNSVLLGASDMPAFAFAFFITSQVQGFTMNPGGSSGNLCVAGAVGRYVGPGQIQQAGTAGTISLAIDLTQIPQPLGFVSAGAGETWNFQAWYRDSSPSGPTSNFTNGLSITFQ